MRIAYERSGGFAGLTLSATVDVSALPPHLARQAAGVDWSSLPTRAGPASGPDRFEHRLEVTGMEGGRRRVVLAESAVPVELRPLLEELQARAAPGPPR